MCPWGIWLEGDFGIDVCKRREITLFNVAICDDNREYIQYLIDVINDANNTYNLKLNFFEYISGEQLIWDFEEEYHIDLLILDIQLGGIDGDETAREFRKRYPDSILVFCSGVRAPTIESFKVTPFRYILKQQNRQDIVQTMKEVLCEVRGRFCERYIMAHYRSSRYRIGLDDILYIENDKRGGRVVVRPGCKVKDAGVKLLVDSKTEKLIEKLYSYGFIRIQSTLIVNMNNIESVDSDEVIFCTGEKIAISRAYRKEFAEAFTKSVGSKY